MDYLNIKFKPIIYGSEDYIAALKLRDIVPRQLLDLSINEEPLEEEKQWIHIGAFMGERLVGIIVLVELGEDIVQMRQVAVDEALRCQGIGSKLVSYAESYAMEIGYKKIVVSTKLTAIRFYVNNNYTKFVGQFFKMGIPHYKMEKELINKDKLFLK